MESELHSFPPGQPFSRSAVLLANKSTIQPESTVQPRRNCWPTSQPSSRLQTTSRQSLRWTRFAMDLPERRRAVLIVKKIARFCSSYSVRMSATDLDMRSTSFGDRALSFSCSTTRGDSLGKLLRKLPHVHEIRLYPVHKRLAWFARIVLVSRWNRVAL